MPVCYICPTCCPEATSERCTVVAPYTSTTCFYVDRCMDTAPSTGDCSSCSDTRNDPPFMWFTPCAIIFTIPIDIVVAIPRIITYCYRKTK